MDQPQEDPQPRPDSGRLAAGIAIIALGVLLLLDRAGVIDWGTRSGWWPILAIIFGVARLAAGGRGVRSGVFWVLVGAWGLLNEYGVLHYEDSWPLLLVIAGGSMVLGSFGAPRRRPVWETGATTTAGASATVGAVGERLSRAERRAARRERHWSGAGLIWIFITFGIVMSLQGQFGARNNWNLSDRRRVTRTETNDTVHRAAILGQVNSVSQATEFHGGDLTAIMGQCDLDLTQAIVAPGETPVINVIVVMGQVTVRVPDDWIVDTRAVPAMGNIRDARSERSHRQGSLGSPGSSGSLGSPSSPGAADAAAPAAAERTHLVLRGAVTMGELIVKD
jgi:cell wall-active antibiotic response 4TMS protein YvqF